LTLRIFSTLSGRVEDFQPLGSPVKIYVCGMTPKFHPHVGHGRTYVAADLVRRTLQYRGYRVRYVQNFTDIDDKTIARGEEEGVSAAEVARKYSESYFESMDRLGVLRADEYPTVTGYMDRIIEFIEGLVAKGFGYAVNGDVWFDVAKFEDYGKLSHRTEEGGLAGARKELEPGKRDPRDFALWKAAKPGEPSWESPWGAGRPGWHIECSTMVRETLGDQIDIHMGGQDLLFPHHENELAQSECFTGLEPFAKYWLHTGLVTSPSGEKMAHSLWNFVTLQDMLDRFEPAGVRLYLLQTHYRSPVAFSEEAIAGATRSLATLRAAFGDPAAVLNEPEGWNDRAADLKARFDAQLDDDFNSAGAVGVLFDAAHEVNRASGASQEELRSLFRLMIGVLGLPLADRPDRGSGDIGPFVELLIGLRASLRAEKQWALADQVRDGLKGLGIALEDSPQGTTWRRAN
jgi:cysteinyl-tRNA synthetase